MTRRKGQAALHKALDQGWVRLRRLLRNEEFRKDLACCYNLEGPSAKHEQTLDGWALIKKWELAWLPISWPKKGPGPLCEVVRNEEEFLIREMKESQEDPEIKNRFIFRLPVETWDPDKVQEDLWLEDHIEELEERGTLLRPPSLKPPGRILMMRVDLDYPQDVLEEVIKLELNKAKRQWVTQKNRQSKGSEKPRQRLDKAILQLKIFDHVTEGLTFPAIARRVKRPVSTVKSLFLAAKLNINNPLPKTRHKNIPLRDFDPDVHVKKCSTCSSAKSFEGMCMLARRHTNKEYRSQRERIYGNPDHISQNDGTTHKKIPRIDY